MATPAEVEQQIGFVLKEYDRAKVGLEMQTTSSAAEFLRGLKSRRGPIDAWATRGRNADLGKNGWRGWSEAGNIHLDGIREHYATGSSEHMRLLEETAKDVAKTVKKLPKQAAKVVGESLGEVAKSGGSEFAWGVGLPILLAAGGIVVALIMARKSLT